MSNPVEVLNREIEDEKKRASSVGGEVIIEICGSLLHPTKRNRQGALTTDSLAELMGIVGTPKGVRRTITYWQNNDRPIPPDQQVLLHRIHQVLEALPETKPRDKYSILTTPIEGLLNGQQVSRIELLRMQSPAGFKAVMSSLLSNSKS